MNVYGKDQKIKFGKDRFWKNIERWNKGKTFFSIIIKISKDKMREDNLFQFWKHYKSFTESDNIFPNTSYVDNIHVEFL